MRDDDKQSVKIELLSQWKLEAEFRNYITSARAHSLTPKMSLAIGRVNRPTDGGNFVHKSMTKNGIVIQKLQMSLLMITCFSVVMFPRVQMFRSCSCAMQYHFEKKKNNDSHIFIVCYDALCSCEWKEHFLS